MCFKAVKILPLIALIGMIVIRCTNQSDYYIISERDSFYRHEHTRDDGVVIMTPYIGQGFYTFVVDSNDQCYYYYLSPDYYSKNYSLGNYTPMSMNLTPNDLIAIPRGKEDQFFEQNILAKDVGEEMKVVILSSLKDTIKNGFVNYLNALKNNKPNNISIRIRKSIPEEEELLKHWLVPYSYDKSKIGKGGLRIADEEICY